MAASTSSARPALSYNTHDLPMFHTGAPVHTHQKCSWCLVMRRAHGTQLSLCKGCGFDVYCSKECQVADWPTHKAHCKAFKHEREVFAKETGMPSAMSDICAWTAYYDTPLKNCAVAAMELTKTPHMERIALLYLQIRHKGDPRLPVADRFEIMSIGRESVSAFPLRDQSPLCIQPESYAQSCERGKLEMGDDFYGVVRYGLTVVFGPEEKPYAATHKWKHFSIDKTTAQAPSTRPDYWTLFREYVKAGAKMKFCCGKVAESAGICCCGGWVHDEEKQDAFSKIGK